MMCRVKTQTTLSTIALGAALAGLALITGWQLIGSWAVIVLVGFAASVALSVAGTQPGARIRGARKLRYFEAPALFDAVDRLVRRSGIREEVDLYYARSRTINAATALLGDRPAIIVTDGLLASLPGRELEGVLAHEIAHIRNKDLTTFRVAEVFRHATRIFARIGLFFLVFALPFVLMSGGIGSGVLLLILAPSLSWLLQLALMRTREFAADATAAGLTGDPLGLALALERIDRAQRRSLRFLGPLGSGGEPGSLFRTHPATSERVARLRNLGRTARPPFDYSRRVSLT